MSIEFQKSLNAISGEERVVTMVDMVLAEVIRIAASDVHFEPTPEATEIKFRIDGVLRPVARLPKEISHNLVARLKVMAELLTYRTDIPQEGGLHGKDGQGAEMRVSTFPTVHGEKAVVRIFRAATPLTELEHLGLNEELFDSLSGLLQERSGILFLTGPSGSGKTTTIYACLRRLMRDREGRHVVSIEDPVEQIIPGVSQSQVRPGHEFDFARGLRSLLRQDPDVIMVGEIRDRETAAVAIEAALTGHLVISTLHSGSAAGVVGRLLEMGIEPYLLTSSVRAILNQRLLRRLCGSCEGHGCEHCHNSGFKGRFLLAELLVPNAEFRRTMLAKADTESLAAVAANSGLRTIRIAAEDAIQAGMTTADEVRRVLGAS
jgi:type II secretory ATPase GspE/PulE/Tfp pilus assembly ATPase PilB-like protein